MNLYYNVSAMIANSKLHMAENNVTKSLERLSSGYKINKAQDNPSGLAVARKLREQINGLERASENSADAISAIQTADSAMTEITAMLQRMRELNIQALNETYTEQDREAIQAEVDALTEEIDRVVRDTEFNGITLLDGTIDRKGYTDNTETRVNTYSTVVMPGEYNYTITTAPSKALYTAGSATVNSTSVITAAMEGSIKINGETLEVKAGETITEVYENLRKVSKHADVNLFVIDTSVAQAGNYTNDNVDSAGFTQGTINDLGTGTFALMFASEEYGSQTHINIECDNNALASALGITAPVNEVGIDTELQIDYTSSFSATASYTANGDKVIFTDRNGFSIDVTVDPDVISYSGGTDRAVSMEINDKGAMTIQVGGNEGQEVDVIIPSISAKSLGIDNLNMIGAEGLNRSLVAIDGALTKVLEVQSKIGAYQNRFDTTVSELGSASYNLEEAFSRIMDTDMAEEMTRYQTNNVIAEAATSMVAQANERPQRVLQLLQ